MRKINLLVITPIWPPGTGGAATYYPLLIEKLLDHDSIGSIHVITESIGDNSTRKRHALGHDDERVKMHYILPNRIARKNRPSNFYHALIYLFQNLTYLRWRRLIRKNRIDVALIHSGFFLAPSLLGLLGGRLIFPSSCFRVADIRDTRSPDHRFKFCDLRLFCSLSCYNAYEHDEDNRDFTIPIPFKPFDRSESHSPCDQPPFDVASIPHPIVTYAGMIRETKNTDKLIDAMEGVRKTHFPTASLCLAGQIRTSTDSSLYRKIHESSGVFYFGELTRSGLWSLLKNSDLVVSPSMIESFPRLCLEAISLRKKVLCPANLLEYSSAIPDWTVDGDDVTEIEKKIIWALSTDGYPVINLDEFSPRNVAERLVQLIMANRC